MTSNHSFAGVWSATPTPFTSSMKVDRVAVKRLVEHHVRLGIKGLFLCGTCGEGPWMRDEDRREVLQTAAAAARGRLVIAMQVTDNSAARIIDNMRCAKEDGADIAVIAPPHTLLNATPENLIAHYQKAIRNSPLPVGVYDLGVRGAVVIPEQVLATVYQEPKVVLVKDSSGVQTRRDLAIEAKRKRPELCLLNGDEFNCVSYLEAGYDGLMLGGAIFNGKLAVQLRDAALAGRLPQAHRIQKRMTRLMWDVYGGPNISCWLTGVKHLLVEMGIFRTTAGFLDYPLAPACKAAIARAMKRDADVLLP